MDRDKFLEIMQNDDIECKLFSLEGCNALAGLLIIMKYLPKSGIGGAGHDLIYACGVDDLIKAGITEFDVIELKSINWMVDEDSLACFV